MSIKKLQFPFCIQSEVTRLTCNSSSVLKNSFYAAYLGKRDRCYDKINELMNCYRVFKEARNCYMHNGLKADCKLIKAYTDYLPSANTVALGVSEIPEFIAPILNENIQISLRGVVGFSYIIIKIIVSLDTELLCSANAEEEFLSRYQCKHTILRTIKPNPIGARKQVKQYVRQCNFPDPHAIDEMITFLLSHRFISR